MGTLDVGNERYTLKNHGAKDVCCYLYLKDIQRIEMIKKNINKDFGKGYTLFITNELSYCKSPLKKDCIYAAFTLEEGAVKSGILDWSEQASEGTKKGCEEPINLEGNYACEWKEYSHIDDTNIGKFIYLLNEIPA